MGEMLTWSMWITSGLPTIRSEPPESTSVVRAFASRVLRGESFDYP
jgi:hypothetical protein